MDVENKNVFLNKTGLVLNNLVDIFYVSIVQILIGLLISYLLDKFMYKNYNNKKDENKALILLLLEFTLLSAVISALSFGISKLLVYLPYPFANDLKHNLNFNHKSNVINKSDAILTIVLFALCKPLQSKLEIIKKKFGFTSNTSNNLNNIVAYNTPKKELPKPTGPLPNLISQTS